MKIGIFASSCIGVLLAACATQKPIETSVPAVATEITATPETELEAQQLVAGECGLFLWNIGSENRFIFFSKAGTQTARFLFNGERLNLSQTNVSGDIFGQFLTMMTYRSGRPALLVELQIEPGEVISGGQKVSRGRLTVTDADSWQTIIPVVGTRACISDSLSQNSVKTE